MGKASKHRQTLGVGFIGTGNVTGAHIETFKKLPGCRLVGVCSRKLDRAARKIAGHQLADAVAYDDMDLFLANDELDIVCIGTPHPSHPAQTIAAAKAGKHVVIEKPVALRRKDLHKMVRAVKKAKVKTSICFELHWIGLFQNIRSLVDNGTLGNLFYGEAAYFHGIGPFGRKDHWNKRKDFGGSALLTGGCHALDALIYLMNAQVVQVTGMSNTSKTNPARYEYDTNSVILLRFDNGAIGRVATSIECRQPYHFPILIQGDKGSVCNDLLSTIDLPGTKGWTKMNAELPESGAVGDHPFLGQFSYFVDCIRRDKRPHNDLLAAAHVHEVIFAAEKAMKSGKTVTVPKVK